MKKDNVLITFIIGLILVLSSIIFLWNHTEIHINPYIRLGNKYVSILIAFIPALLCIILKSLNDKELLFIKIVSIISFILGLICMIDIEYVHISLFFILVLYVIAGIGIYLIIKSLL